MTICFYVCVVDLPFVISTDIAAFLDPHQRYTGTDKRGWSSNISNFLSYRSHAASFGYIGSCSVLPGTTYYPATLFRFPLRLPGASSEISSTAYSVERVKTFLFRSFIKEAPLILLFLKHVEEISLYDGNRLLYKISIHPNHKATVRSERNALIQLGLSKPSYPTLRLYSMSICVDHFFDEHVKNMYHWLIFNMIGSSFRTIQDISQKLKILPWVGIAAPLPDILNLKGICLSNVDLTQLSNIFSSIELMIKNNLICLPWSDKVRGHTEGHVFCFLPLPSKTHLPVNIHGYFAISDNRRSIEWPSFDNESDKAIWNKMLVLQHVAPLYSVVICCRSKLITYTNSPLPVYEHNRELTDPYAAWPLYSEVQHKEIWSELVIPTVIGCLNNAVFWSAIGCWVSLNQAIFIPKESKFPIPDRAIKILYLARVPIVNLPIKVWQTIIECNLFNNMMKVITPFHVRYALKHTKVCFESYQEIQPVLEYILCDITDKNYSELEGLDVIPLATTNFQTQAFSSKLSVVYMLTKENLKLFSLLPGIETSFVNLSVFHSPLIEKKFIEIATLRKFQLQLVTPNDFCRKLLPQSIKTWKFFNCNESIKWQPKVATQPSYQWIVSLWQWLCENPFVLTECVSLPILPQQLVNDDTTECTLLPIPSGKRKYYVSQFVNENDKIVYLLSKFGGVTLKRNGFVFFHSKIHNFVQLASVPNLLQYLEDSDGVKIIDLNDQDKFFLRELIAQYYDGKPVPNNFVQLIYKLPIFEVGVGGTPITLSSLEFNNILPPLTMMFHSDLQYPRMLRNNDKYLFNLFTNCLQYKVSLQDNVYLVILTDAIHQCSNSSLWNNGDNLILWTMAVCPNLSERLISFLSNQRFIRTNFGQLKKPSEMYNPYDEPFHKLFDDSIEHIFPNKGYYNVLNVLNNLGLKSWACLTNNSESFIPFLIDRAKSVSALSLDKAFERSCYILELIGLYTKYSSRLMEAIKSIKFLIVESLPPNEFPCGPTWCGMKYKNKFESPDGLCFSDENIVYLVGSVLPILSSAYLQHLKIQIPFAVTQKFLLPTPDHVILQLSVLTEITRKTPSIDINKVYIAAHKIYEYLNTTNLNFMLPKSWIMFKNEGVYTFVSEERFAINSFFDFSPFIYSVYPNSELTRYRRLLQKSQIRNSPSCEDLAEILQSIKQCIQTPLTDKFIKMSVVILEYLEKEKHQSKGNIFLPTTNFTLSSVNECTYDDREWCRKSIGTVGHTHAFVHESVAPYVAKYFGVEPLSQKIAPSIKLGFKYIQVGQKEDVTRRLNGIVNDYSGKNDVFKEIIQNADDACATEIKFVLDCRQHGCKSLFNDQMRYWQGPALIAYNNATFSDQDFDNVCELAGETKMSDPMKTGRFGVGFCACYSLTDVPSFLSRRFLTIFDPHTKYLGDRVSYREPGMRLDLIEVKEDLKIYQDQLAPYDGIFGCDVFDLNNGGYNGTIFRLPIRMKGNPLSKISRNYYDLPELKFMINHLEKEADKLLLFLKHIKLLELYVLDKNAKSVSEMKLAFKVEKKTEKGSSRLEIIQNFVKNPNVPLSPVCDNIVITVNRKQQVTERRSYILASAISYHSSKLKKGLLPLAELVIEVDKNGIPIPYNKHGQLFCFLPLPLESFLPFHVNGYFDVGKDRRGLRDAQENDEHLWNKALIKHTLPLAFECALENVAKQFNPSTNDFKFNESSLAKYYSLWPGMYGFSKNITENWLAEEFIISVKKSLCCCNKHILWSEVNSGKWVSVSEAFIFKKSKMPPEIEKDAVNILLSKCYSIIQCPAHVIKLLESSIAQNNHAVDYKAFAKNFLFPNITEMPKSSMIMHLLFVMKKIHEEDRSINKSFPWAKEILSANKCIPVKGSNSLSYPHKLIHSKCGHVATMFKESDGCFVHEQFTKDYCTDVLISLGMVTDILPVSELAKRAHTVSELNGDEADERVVSIFEYIIYFEAFSNPIISKRMFSEQGRQERIQALCNISFLKAIPNIYNDDSIPWYVPVKRLFSPSELFHPRYKNLIFSQRPVFWPQLYGLDDNELPSYIGISDQEPNIDIVIDNLCALIEKVIHPVQKLEESVYLFLDNAFQEMYMCLNRKCESNKEKLMIYSRLASTACIWQDRKLLLPIQVVCELNFTSQYYPYLSSLSMTNKQLECFFVSIGVEKQLNNKFILNVLDHVQRDYDSKPLSEEHLELIHILTRELANTYDSSKDKGAILPDESGVLRSCCLLTCDSGTIFKSNWVISTPAYTEFVQKGGHCIHSSISRKVALKLGACTILDAVMKDVEDHGFLRDTEFGQYEDLVDRLNGILKKYPSDTSIFKEFIQNADDAKASEITFILDHRINHPNVALLSEEEGWKKLQNVPALCIFNNKPFTDNDIAGICKLGRGTKGETSDTIGRFGIGFNAAYHLTDCPTFVSFDKNHCPTDFCAFDPLRMYCSANRNGRRWKDANGKLNRCPDQFHPFLLNLFSELRSLVPSCFSNIDDGFTMFRLPLIHWRPGNEIPSGCLRPNNYLSESRIDNISTVKQLLLELKSFSNDILLFLNNIKRLSVFEVNGVGKYHHHFSVEASCSNTSEMPKTNLVCTNEMKLVVHELQNKIPIISKWILNKRKGMASSPDEAELFQLGAKRGLEAVGGTAVLIDYSTIMTGSLFCFLPIPIKSCLPVHLNGYFLLDDSRNHLAKNVGLDKWNHMIAECVLVPSYVDLILKARDYVDGSSKSVNWFYSLFPNINTHNISDASVLKIAEMFYKKLSECNHSILLDKGELVKGKLRWLQINRGKVGLFCVNYIKDGLTIFSPPVVSDVLVKLGMSITCAPNHVYSGFCKTSENYISSFVGLITPEKVTDHLKTVMLHKDTTQLLLDNSVHIIEFCLQDCTGIAVRNRLKGVPILKSEANTLVDTNVLYFSQFSALLPKYSREFAHMSMEKTVSVRKKLIEGRVIVPLPINVVAMKIDIPSVDKPVKLSDHQKQLLVLLWQYLQSISCDISLILQYFNDKPIIPSSFSTFYPCKLRKCVFYLRNHGSTVDIRDTHVLNALNKLGYPSLNFSVISKIIPPFVPQMISTSLIPNDILSCLKVLPPLSISGNLSKNEIAEFFCMLSRCMEIPTYVSVSLRRLPLFENFKGMYLALEGVSNFIFVPENCPLNGLQTVQKNSKCMFLKFPNDILDRVYSKIIPKHDYHLSKITCTHFYHDFVVPQFVCLTDSQMQEHLKVIDALILSPCISKEPDSDEAKLINLLKKTPFILKDGVRYLVSDFYDQSRFHACFNRDKLLPKEWIDGGIVSRVFLKMLGLRGNVNYESWIYNARRVANEGAKSTIPHENLIERSNTLVQMLKEKVDENMHVNYNKMNEAFIYFLKVASKIKFIYQPFVSRLEDLLKAIFSKQSHTVGHFVQLSGAVFSKHKNIACFSNPILPKTFDFLISSEYKVFLEYLSITEPIFPKMVIHNLKCLVNIIISYNVEVCAPNHNRVKDVLELKKIFEEHYRFLDRHIDKDQDSYKQLLNEACFLLSPDNLSLLMVESTRLVKVLPKSVSLEPFCFKVPSEFLRYPLLLKAVEVREELEAIDYLNLLSMIDKEMKETDIKVLNDDRRLYSVCSDTYKLLIIALRNDQNYVLSKVHRIVLPSTDFCLCDSSELIYNDMPWIADYIEGQKFKFLLPPPVDHRGQSIPPTCLRVKLLSELAVVELSKNILNPSNKCAKQELFESGKKAQNCSVIISLKDTLQSLEFVKGLERLYWHENKTHPNSNAQFCKQLKMLQEISTQKRIHCVNCILTILKLDGKEVPGTEDKSQLCYLKKMNGSLTLFVSHSLTQSSVDYFLDQLASALKEQFHHNVKNELPIKAMLRCSPCNITYELDKLKISPFDSNVQTSSKLLDVGTEISIKMFSFRREDLVIFCNYSIGEKVVYHCLVGKRPVLKVGCVMKCEINLDHPINSAITLHVGTVNGNKIIILVSPVQVYKELSARDYVLLSSRKRSQYSTPLVLVTVPSKMDDLNAWLFKVIKTNAKTPYCLMTHLRQRLVAHMHYFFLFNLYNPSCFHFALTTITDLLKYENNLPCDEGDITVYICKKFDELSIEGQSETTQVLSDTPVLLDYTSKVAFQPISVPNLRQNISGTTKMPRLNFVPSNIHANTPISYNRFPQQKGKQCFSRFTQGMDNTAPPQPSTDSMKAKAWLLQAKVDYMSACDIYMNSNKTGNGAITFDFTDAELMEIDDIFIGNNDTGHISGGDVVNDTKFNVYTPGSNSSNGRGVIESSIQSLSIQCKYPALVCFLCHDVVEKCIKGIMYAKCGLPDSLIDCRNLNKLCAHIVQSKTCPKLVEDALRLASVYVTEHGNSSRYPNYHYPTCAPFLRYSITEAVETIKIVSRLMTKVKESDLCDLVGEINVLPEIETTSAALTKCIFGNTGKCTTLLLYIYLYLYTSILA